MDARVTALETRLDTTLPTLATKADLSGVTLEVEKVRTEIHQSTAGLVKWIVGTGIASLAILISILTFLLNRIDKAPAAPAAAPAPVIIQVPAYQPPPTPPQAPAQ